MIALDEWLHTDILTLGMAADEARRRTALQVTYLRVHVVTPRDLTTTFSVPEAASEVRIHEIPSALPDAKRRRTFAMSYFGVSTGTPTASIDVTSGPTIARITSRS